MNIGAKRFPKAKKCKEFFSQLTMALSDSYELLPSCNKDYSLYLCQKGTCHEVTYCGKPEESFRLADHWNWYSNTRKCPDPNYVQCFNVNLPKAKKREKDGYASIPRVADCVAFFKNGVYHTIYGEYFDFKTKTWAWKEATIDEVLKELDLISALS